MLSWKNAIRAGEIAEGGAEVRLQRTKGGAARHRPDAIKFKSALARPMIAALVSCSTTLSGNDEH